MQNALDKVMKLKEQIFSQPKMSFLKAKGRPSIQRGVPDEISNG